MAELGDLQKENKRDSKHQEPDFISVHPEHVGPDSSEYLEEDPNDD